MRDLNKNVYTHVLKEITAIIIVHIITYRLCVITAFRGGI